MDLLLKNVKIYASHSQFHKKVVDLRLFAGKIERICPQGEAIEVANDTKIIEAEHLALSIGWFDLRAFVPDPSQEHKETFAQARAAAAKGGFTEVLLMPYQAQTAQSKTHLEYIQRQSEGQAVQFHAVAPVTLQLGGKDLSEMIDLHHSGALAFSDGNQPLANSDLLYKVLLYLQMFDGLLINRPEEQNLSKFGQMHEGEQSTRLGLKGIPSIAEELMVSRDLQILAHTGGKLHLSQISTARSVALIRQAKAQGLSITCDVAAHHLVFTDEALQDFDTNFKVNPPFRSAEDVAALWQGLADGSIDAICTAHQAQDTESKALEFDLAEFGVTGLETAFAALNTYRNNRLSLSEIIDKISGQPRKVLGLDLPEIKEGAVANLTLFDPQKVWQYTPKMIQSGGQNSPFLNQSLKGKALGIFHQNNMWIDAEILG